MRYYPFAILVLAMVACSKSTAPSRGLETSTNVAPATFRAGDAVNVTVDVTNRSDQPRTIETNPCPDPFVVTNLAGVIVAPSERICSAVSMPRTLAPGEQYVFTQRWSGDARGPTPIAAAVILAPGTYSVRSRLEGPGIESSSTTIHVTP